MRSPSADALMLDRVAVAGYSLTMSSMWRIWVWRVIPMGVAIVTLACSKKTQAPAANTQPESMGIGLATVVPVTESEKRVTNLAAYFKEVDEALKSGLPVVGIRAFTDRDPALASAIHAALGSTAFVKLMIHAESGEPLLNEIIAAEVDSAASDRFRIEMFNYYSNTSAVVWVDRKTSKVVKELEVSLQPPKASPRLGALATELVLAHPDIRRELGLRDGESGAGLKVVLEETQGDRSRHLVAAPVIYIKDLALWTLVDLTDWQVVGWQWMAAHNGHADHKVTERSLQNDAVMEHECEVMQKISRDGWELEHRMTRSDGVEILNASFHGTPVLRSAKLVQWHVSYHDDEEFGYTDSMGAPMFSTSKVVASHGAEAETLTATEKLPGGFALVQDFRSAVWPMPCNYRFQNRFEFYADGRFRVCGVNLGRGCTPVVRYRPVFRVEFVQDPKDAGVEQWMDDGWKAWAQESWMQQQANTPRDPAGCLFRIHTAAGRGYAVEPSWGQFGVGSRMDAAYCYVTALHADRDEGTEDLPVIGEWASKDFRQGPERFIDAPAEALAGKPLVFWYVPQFAACAEPGKEYAWAATRVERGKAKQVAWPAVAGPMFVPFSQP